MRVQLTFRLRPSSFSVLCVFLILSAAGICGQTDATKQVFDREDAYLNAETSAHSFRGAVLARNGRLLSADSLKQMFTPYPEAAYQGQHYGYGVVISQLKFGKLLYYHGGGVQGFSSSIQRYPKERVCIIVLSNLDPSKPWELGDHIASGLFSQPLPTAH